MADISMCQYDQCLRHNSCYRFLAELNPQWQSYMKFQNICNESNNYQWYWKAELEENKVEQSQTI